MIATVDVADIGAWGLVKAIRHRPRPGAVPGLHWLDVGPIAALASYKPPTFRRAAMVATWEDEEAARRFTETHSLAASFAGGFHAVLRPLRAFGSWPGLGADVSRHRVTHHDGPVFVTTLARLRFSQGIRFFRASRPAEHAAVEAHGFLWGTAVARPPFLSTLSLWASDEAVGAYAYGDGTAGHPRAIDRQRRKDFHHESAFIRHAIVSATGALPNGMTVDPGSVAAS